MYSPNLISPNDYKGDKKKSDISTELFKQLALKKNLNPQIFIDDSDEQKRKGIDALLDLNGIRVAVDIKSKSSFGDAICLEYKKISGTTGSLFLDHTDYFAIEREDGFYFIKTKELREKFIKLVNINSESICTEHKDIVWDIKNCRYKLYTMLNKSQFKRWWDKKPNEDSFAYVLWDDIKDLVVYILENNENTSSV